jgi:RNA polymerase sigma-70 factor (ECF subfamily)
MKNATDDPISHYRSMLFSIAYNMLGSLTDAEDMVQDTFLNWYKADTTQVDNPKFYLIRAVINRCISHLQKQQQRRINYTGTWLPEPLVSEMDAEEHRQQESQKLSIGFLYLLEKLSPPERGVLILREGFNLTFQEIASIFNISQNNCRQLLSRARSKLQQDKKRFVTNEEQHSRILKKFMDACLSGNLNELTGLLQEDVSFYSDGGGKASAALHPLYGREIVAKFIHGIVQKTGPVFLMQFIPVNGLQGAVIYKNEDSIVPDLLITLDAHEAGGIQNLYFIRNPDKLRHIKKNV